MHIVWNYFDIFEIFNNTSPFSSRETFSEVFVKIGCSIASYYSLATLENKWYGLVPKQPRRGFILPAVRIAELALLIVD